MKIFSYSPAGHEGQLIDIETDIRRGIPGIDIVGLPDGAVRETCDRIRIAAKRSGLVFPVGRIVINLTPAGIRKGGESHDLALALSLLLADNQIRTRTSSPVLVLGEMQLSGKILPVHNIVSAIACALDHGIRYLMVPLQNYGEAASFGCGTVLAVGSLDHALQLLAGPSPDGQSRNAVHDPGAGIPVFQFRRSSLSASRFRSRSLITCRLS
ncbi:MAG: hypothetical protein JW874_14460 [Spirochaetales bacterium]|nr:hypothetical protein [Spirochaetales bacterium]